jgi:hypothetical protein
VNKENPSIVTKWLSGTHNFTVDTLVELGNALDINLLNLSEPEPKVVMYFQSVSQMAQTTCNDTFLNDILKKMEEQAPAYPVGSWHGSFDSHKQLAQA